MGFFYLNNCTSCWVLTAVIGAVGFGPPSRDITSRPRTASILRIVFSLAGRVGLGPNIYTKKMGLAYPILAATRPTQPASSIAMRAFRTRVVLMSAVLVFVGCCAPTIPHTSVFSNVDFSKM